MHEHIRQTLGWYLGLSLRPTLLVTLLFSPFRFLQWMCLWKRISRVLKATTSLSPNPSYYPCCTSNITASIIFLLYKFLTHLRLYPLMWWKTVKLQFFFELIEWNLFSSSRIHITLLAYLMNTLLILFSLACLFLGHVPAHVLHEQDQFSSCYFVPKCAFYATFFTWEKLENVLVFLSKYFKLKTKISSVFEC